MTELSWRSISTSQHEQRKFKNRNVGFLRQMQKEDLSNHSINDPTLLKRKENANDCTTSTWQGLSKTTEPFLAVNNNDKEKKAGGSTKSRGETCLQLRHRRQTGIKPNGRRAVGILSILQGLTVCETFFSELRPVSVAWRKTSR